MSELSEKYWNSLLKKYREGYITEDERFLLEKKALDDPFLFDALEGFGEEYVGDSTIVQKDVTKSGKSIFSIQHIAIAASFVLALSTIAIVLNNKSDRGSKAQNEGAYAQVLQNEKDQNQQEEGSEETKKVVTSSDFKETTKTDATQSESKENNDSNGKLNSNVTEDEQTKDRINSQNRESDDEAVVSSASNSTPSMQSSTVADAGVDLDQAASTANSNAEMVESEKGNAEKIPVSKAKRTREAIRTSPPKSENLNNISKVVPVIGESTFNDFAKEKIAARGLDQGGTTKIVIEFSIDNNGMLSDFKQMPSSCSECSAYAISLLQKSGEWKTVPPGKTGRSMYVFYF